jgi:hypothetical protein
MSDKGSHVVVSYHLMNKFMALQTPDESQRRVAGVQKAEFCGFIGSDVRNHLGTNIVPPRSAIAKLILYDPLTEWFGDDQAVVDQSEHIGGFLTIGRCGCGADSVDHRRWKRHVVFNPP